MVRTIDKNGEPGVNEAINRALEAEHRTR